MKIWLLFPIVWLVWAYVWAAIFEWASKGKKELNKNELLLFAFPFACLSFYFFI